MGKKIEAPRGLRNKDHAEFPIGRDEGTGVCLFVKQQYRRLAHSCPAKLKTKHRK
jgi:hypothetical protein